MLDFLLKATELKDEKRKGWILRKIDSPERVAGHSWGSALLCSLFADDENIDPEKAVKMALVHDINEMEMGDVANRFDEEKRQVDDEEKERMKEESMRKIVQITGGGTDELVSLWEEFEEEETETAKFVRDMDKIDMVLQALKYEKEQRYDADEENPNFDGYEKMDEFFLSAEEKITTDTGNRLFQEIKERYEETK